MTGWITALARAGLITAIVVGIFAGVIPPSAVHADTNLTIGGQARIAYANGDGVRFRTAPGSDAPVIQSIAEGTIVTVLDGPVDDGSGILWYQVSVDGQVGYVAEQFLALADGSAGGSGGSDGSGETATTPEPIATTISGPTGTITGTSGAGARCRIAPDAQADVIVTVPEGTVVALAGDRSGDWQPVVCQEQTGYVAAQFVLIPGQPQPVETPAPAVETEPAVVEEPAVTPEPTEEPAATEAPAETETATTEPAVTQEATVEPETTETATDEATAPSDTTGEATAAATETPAEGDVTPEATATEPATDATATETPDVTETATPADGATDTPETTATATATATEAPTGTPIPEAEAGVTPDATSAPIAQTPVLGTPVLSGTAIVVGTNGGGLQCRVAPDGGADVIATLAERSVVQTRGAAKDGWLPIVCDGQEGYAEAAYLLLDVLGGNTDTSADTGTSASGDVGATVGSAVVAGTNGSGLRCRVEPNGLASLIVVLREGTTVALRDGSVGGYQAVICGGRNGFVNKKYLGPDTGTTDGTVTAAALSSVTGSAIVAGTNGAGLRCRADASFSASVLMILTEGSTVALRGAASNGWQPIYCGKTSSAPAGFVAADYLGNVTQQSDTGSSSGSGSQGTAVVATASGNGARLRARASSGGAIIMIVPNGATVTLRAGSTGVWTAVSYKGNNGFIHNSLLGSGGTTGGGTTPASPPATGLKAGDRAETTANLNLRYSASYSAGVAAVAPAGTVVKITGGATSGFYPVDWDGLTGYMHGDYLTKTTKALSTRGGSGDGGTTGGNTGGTTGGGGGGSATGSAMVNFAMQYLGYPYVWATAGPSSFDCSGFTYWVTKNVLGMDIGRGLWTQVAAGTAVSYDQLQPGDLVFFQNTYTWGLSHVGLYIGNGQFIHAENESTGVVISSLSSTYYSTRWYGAVRLG